MWHVDRYLSVERLLKINMTTGMEVKNGYFLC